MRVLKMAATSMFVVAVLAAVSPALADTNLGKVQIPFDFVVNQELLPSGQYDVTVASSGVVRLQLVDGRSSAAVLTLPANEGAPARSKSGQLVFEPTDDQPVLTQIWFPGTTGRGRELLKARGLQGQDPDNRVAIQMNTGLTP